MADDGGELRAVDPTEGPSGQRVDASNASGVQVGEGNTQFNYFYGAVTWSDRVAAPPLVTVSGDIESPYRGLNSFDERDAAFFFGRDAAVSELVGRVQSLRSDGGLIVVSGVSGSGKSSLLRAGLAPRLRPPESESGTGWVVLYLAPSSAPMDALAVGVANLGGLSAPAVARDLRAEPASIRLILEQIAHTGTGQYPEDRVLLIVDQFEQVFTLCSDEREREDFIRALHAACTPSVNGKPPAWIGVIGVRADFEARCADYDDLAEAVQRRYLLTAMTELQLRAAIVEPARMAGVQVDAALVSTLVGALRAHHSREEGATGGRAAAAGALPLLSHALDQAWRSRTGPHLTLADYDRTGGIDAAVAASAQSTFERLSAKQQSLAKTVFLQLTSVQTDGLDVGAAATRADLMAGMGPSEQRDVDAVLEAFAAKRLLTLDSDTVEISHEAVLSAWPLLRDTWLAQTHTDRLVRTRLRSSAHEWDRHGRDASYLYQGTMRASAEESVHRMDVEGRTASGLSPLESDFLAASGRAQRRRLRMRRATMAAVGLLIVGLMTSTIWASRATVDAQLASADALKQRDTALSKQLLSQSDAAGTDPDTARVMSLAAWSLTKTDDTWSGLERAAARSRATTINVHTDAVWSTVVTSKGQLLTGSADGTVRIWDIDRRKETAPPIHGPLGGFAGILPSPDGTRFFAANPNGSVGQWRLSDGRQVGTPFKVGDLNSASVGLSDDGRTLLTSTEAGLTLWDVAHPQARPREISTQPDQLIQRVQFGRGDSELVLLRGTPRIVHGGTVTGLRRALKQCGLVAAVSRDGNDFVCTDEQSTNPRAWLVRISAAKIARTPLGIDLALAVFSPSGRELAVTSADGRLVTIFDVSTGETIADPRTSPGGSLDDLTFNLNGQLLIGGGANGSLTFWNVRPKARVEGIVGRSGTGYSSVHALAPGSQSQFASLGQDGMLELRRSDKVVKRYRATTGELTGFALGPDRRTFAATQIEADGLAAITLRDIHSGATKLVIRHVTGGTLIAFNPSGRLLAFDDENGVKVARVADGKVVANYPNIATRGAAVGADGGEYPTSLAFDYKDRLIIGTVTGILDTVDRLQSKPHSVALLAHERAINAVAMEPHRGVLASASDDGIIRLWDLTTHAPVGASFGSGSVAVTSLAMSPDGHALAEGRANGDIQLWDVATRTPIGAPLAGHGDLLARQLSSQGSAAERDGERTAAVTSLDFSPDGKTMLSAGGDGTLRRWNTEYLTNPVSYLCAELDRKFLLAEWAKLAPSAPAVATVCTR